MCFQMCTEAVFTQQAFMFASTCCSYQVLIDAYIHLLITPILLQRKLAEQKRHARGEVTKDVTSVLKR